MRLCAAPILPVVAMLISQSVSAGPGGGGAQQWVYICSQTAQLTDVVQFLFDDKGVLQISQAVRSGSNAPPRVPCTP